MLNTIEIKLRNRVERGLRNTYTPTNIPHVHGNCGVPLNREETFSVSGLKTSSNNSDAALIATEHAKQNMSVPAVIVLNMRGQPLMSTAPRKARSRLNRKSGNMYCTGITIRVRHVMEKFQKVN